MASSLRVSCSTFISPLLTPVPSSIMALPVPSENPILDTKPLLGYSSERSSYPPRPIPPSNPHVAFSTLVFTVTWAVTSNAIHCATYSIIFSMVGYYALGRRARDAAVWTRRGRRERPERCNGHAQCDARCEASSTHRLACCCREGCTC